MKHVVVHRPGGFETLRMEEAPEPYPQPGEVRVATKAIGVNYADVVIRMGLYESAWKYVGYPITPGFEVSGIVDRVGPGVRNVKVGDDVVAVTRFGGYATHVCVSESQVVPRPKQLSYEEAAAFPSVFLTAWYALRELARPRPGGTILVHSAAGGVGTALIQIAKILECRAVGVVGASHKVDLVRELGAEVIDKSSEPLWKTAERLSPGGYDVVLDANGVETLKESYRHLAPGGRLVIYGFHTMLPRTRGLPNPLRLLASWLRTPRFDPIAMTGDNRSVHAFNLSYLFDRNALFHEAIGELFTWLEQGKLRPPPVRVYAFDDVQETHRALQSATTVGKLVLVP